ncbi:5-deoxy-glucuronate isomerase [Streptomyces polyrhachis]|uniref:5-deoxy-glucuronate isomerase n=1 Tax=Streptomyces polyrhachis TaxID=1282885 RepID=A0ABW2GCJ1_9ACTN
MTKTHLRAGESAEGPYRTVITPETAGWRYSGLRVLDAAPGVVYAVATGDAEHLVLPLAGGCAVEAEGASYRLVGRSGVFGPPSDFLYLPRDCEARLTSRDGGRFALPSARCERRLPVRYGPAGAVPIELRGAGSCSRQVHDYCLPHTFAAERLLVCEVLTPGGNWSSYPPHKHDEQHPGTESELEEVYYFQTAPGGLGYQRVRGTPGRPLDVLAEVRDGDTVLVPHGWHGPSTAAPGYDLYYLNVMAGPGPERAWLIRDDPAHAWVRATWPGQQVDPRLPFAAAPHPQHGGAR